MDDRTTHRTTQSAGRVALVALIAVTGVIAAGCGRRAVRRDGELNAHYERTLLHIAARDTGCPAQQLAPALLAPGDPAVYSVNGCGAPVEYYLVCGRRGRRCRWERVTPLEQTAAASLQCSPQAVQQQPTQAPTTRYAAGCGRQAPFTLGCNQVACGWAMSGPMEGAGPAVAAGQPQVAVQASQPVGNAGADLQQRLMGQREAILSCLDDVSNLSLTLRWTAAGQVILQIPPELTNTAAEGCIEAAVGALTVQAPSQPGQITVVLQ